MKNKLSIGFVGMTHLGITSAAAAAKKGWNVVCFDPRSVLISDLIKGRIPVTEPGLNNAIKRNHGTISFVSDPEQLKTCDLAYIAMDVPTDDSGNSDLQPIRKLAATVESYLPKEAVLINMCQVPPGFTRRLNHPADLLYYQVETLIYGQALERALKPDRIIVGCAKPDEKIDNRLKCYLDSFDCPVFSMRYESAELAKISINLCLVASLSVANTMSELCEKLGADWNEIIPALKHDQRIGHYAYLRPGLGISGGNLERDLATIIQLAEINNTNAEVVKSWISDSAYRKNWVFRKLCGTILSSTTTINLAVLGLAYKEGTSSIKNSPGIALLSALAETNRCHQITVYDPKVKIEDTPIENVLSAETALQACQDAEALAVMTPWSEFRLIAPNEIARAMKGKWIIDPYSLFDSDECAIAGMRHLSLGRPPVPW